MIIFYFLKLFVSFKIVDNNVVFFIILNLAINLFIYSEAANFFTIVKLFFYIFYFFLKLTTLGGRHRLTDTYGRNMTDAEKAYYYSLSPRDALAYDLWNARGIYIQQGKYTPEMRQGLLDVIKRNKSDHPNLFNK